MNRILKTAVKAGVNIVSNSWEPHSHLILVRDGAGWVLDWEMRELKTISKNLNIRTLPYYWIHGAPQSVFFASQFFLLDNKWLDYQHRVGFSFFHGLPHTGEKIFDEIYEKLCQHHQKISRIQVSHSEMKNVILSSGIESQKVHLIPIGVNLSYFPFQNKKIRIEQRKKLGIPENAFVVGSFQKDGNGWGEGMEPKLIKGPDIFLKTLAILKSSIPELFVLLTGPARGYVKAGLEKLNIPYRHTFIKHYPEIGKLFQALDVYLVTSRQEGGPKAILESMASGIPIISTRVGQAMDIVQHEKNGWLVDIEDYEYLAHWSNYVFQNRGNRLEEILKNGLSTAKDNSYISQLPLWKNFMEGFVE